LLRIHRLQRFLPQPHQLLALSRPDHQASAKEVMMREICGIIFQLEFSKVDGRRRKRAFGKITASKQWRFQASVDSKL
jgi:hypothetical protein